MLQCFISLLVPSAQTRVNAIWFLIAGYSCLSHLDLESTIEQSQDYTIQEQDGIQDIAELRLAQGR